MALPQLSSSDVGAPARDKINAAIVEADKVGGIAAALAALQITLAPYTDLVGGTPNRPGDSRTLFTRQMTGAPKLRPAIDKGTVENGGELGQVLRIAGADTDPGLGYIDVAPRRAYYMRPGRAYLVRHAFARFQDPTDPANNAVELRFQNLSSTFGVVSDVRFGDPYTPLKNVGAYFVDTFIGKAGAPGSNSYTVPETSRYGVPYFRVYGNGHQTDLGEVWLYDVTDALAGGADIASLLARVATLERGQGQAQSAGIIQRNTWSSGGTADTALSLVTPVLNTIGRVPDTDTGSHAGISTEAGYGVPGPGLVPNAGEYAPTGTPVAWRRTGDTTSKAAAAALLAGAPVKTIIADAEFVMTVSADKKSTSLIPWADFKTLLEGISVEKRFRFYQEPTNFGPDAKLWWASDLFRNGGEIVHNGQSGTLLIGYGKPPLPYSAHTKTLGPGDWESFRDGSQQAIYLASADSIQIPVYSFFTNTSNVNPLSDALADAWITRMSGTQSTADRTTLRALYKRLYADGAGPLRKFRTAYLLANTDPSSSRIDMVRDGKRITLFNDPVHTAKRGFLGEPSRSTYFDWGYVPATDTGINPNNYSMGVYADSGLDIAGSFAMGAQTLAIGVNRPGPSGTARSASTSTDVVTVTDRGGLFAASRNTSDKYRYIYKQTAQDVVRASSAFSGNNFSMLGLCNTGTTGATAFTQTTPRFMFVGEYMTDAELFLIDTAMAEYMAAIGS
ncbi:hypothetical protein [Methylobacterium sp. CM6244]